MKIQITIIIKSLIVCFLLLVSCSPIVVTAQDHEDQRYSFGVNAVTLAATPATSPTIEDLLKDKSHTLLLNNFYRMGGERKPVTPTQCYITYNKDSLFILFKCTEPNMSYPSIQRDINWYKKGYFTRDVVFTDKVDVYFDYTFNKKNYYQFTVTKEGKQFAQRSKDGKVKKLPFRSTVTRLAKSWFAFLRIPWKAVGGKPQKSFGLLPIRTRWRDGEVTSPVAFNTRDRPAMDLAIETDLGKTLKKRKSSEVISLLPSGFKRWVRPALLKYPSQETIKDIYALQQAKDLPTTPKNLSSRAKLIQAWTDLLRLEGFSFSTGAGSIVLTNMNPDALRWKVNHAFRQKDIEKVCSLMDDYLNRLRRISSVWFADGSVADIHKKSWSTLQGVKGFETEGQKITLSCYTKDHNIDLHLCFPQSGGIRIWGNKKGFFNPDSLSPLKVRKTGKGYQIAAGERKIGLTLQPFKITYHQKGNSSVFELKGKNISFLFDTNDSVKAVDFKNRLNPQETIYGFGERYDHLDQHGRVLTLWDVDYNGRTIGIQNQTYKPIPFFHSSKGYSVFINSSYRLRADIGCNNPDQYRLTQQGPIFDYYIWVDKPLEAIRSYTDLTGKPLLPPKWAFGFWDGRRATKWNQDHPITDQKNTIEKFHKLDIPLSVFYAEGGINRATNPDLYSFLAPKNIRILAWENSIIPKSRHKKLVPELSGKQLPYLKFEDTVHAVSHDIASYVDFTHPNALKLARRWWKSRIDLGLDGSMLDFGDEVPEDAIFYNGKSGKEMHNFYAYYYHKTYSEVFKERRGNDYILFARSAAPGDQQWVTHFSGDHSTNFKGLYEELKGGLNFSACGFSSWATELGGHGGWPDPVVYMRWTQFACFNPLMRAHGLTPREPWFYGSEAVKNFKYYTWVRENLLDYIYNEAVYSHQTGLPLMKSMAVAFPEDKSMSPSDDQYLFGRDLLIAPIITDDTSRTVTFPPGQWINLWNGSAHKGSDAQTIDADYRTIPVFLKEGAILPVSLDSALEFGESMTNNSVQALIITPPREQIEKRIEKKHKEEAKVILRPTEKGFSVEMDGLLNMLYLIIYDTKISQVKAKGEDLPKLKGKNRKTLPPGWFVDSNHHRTIIRLPSNKKRKIVFIRK